MEKPQTTYIKTLGEIQATSTLSLEEKGYSDSEKANALIFSDPLAFVIGLIFDQSIQSRLAWEAPLVLQERLGHLDAQKIASMNEEDLKLVIAAKKALHRYPGNMARYLIASCSVLVSEFDAQAENLWKGDQTVATTRKNFLKLSGIGEKKRIWQCSCSQEISGFFLPTSEAFHWRSMCISSGSSRGAASSTPIPRTD